MLLAMVDVKISTTLITYILKQHVKSRDTREKFSFKSTLFIHSKAHTYHKVDGKNEKSYVFYRQHRGINTEMSMYLFQRL